jgi:hypothetical protein
MDMQVEKFINENTNTLEGDVFHIDGQCETNDIEIDNNKVQLNWILDRLIDFGFENVKIELIYWVQQHES